MRDGESRLHDNVPNHHWSRLYLTAVTLLGLGALALIVASTSSAEAAALAQRPAFWMIMGLAIVGELRPILAPASKSPSGVTMSTMFTFAALLLQGLPGAVAVQVLATCVAALVHRKHWARTVFGLGRHTLNLVVAWWVLDEAGASGGSLSSAAPSGRNLIYVAA